MSGAKETFAAVLTYDTLELYGKVETTLPIVIEAAPEPPAEEIDKAAE